MANTDKFLAGKAIGTVKGINGEAIAIDAKGVKRILHAGDKVFPDEVIQTQNGVTVQIEFTNGGFATVGGGDTLALDHTTVADAGAAPKVAPLPSAAEIESLQKMIVQGKDPSDAGESAAAGQASGGGAEEGSSFVIVEQNAARGEVTPGFDTTTFSSAQPSDVIETAYYALETDEQPTPPGKEALNDYNQRMVMYVDKEQAGDSMIGQAQFNKNQGVQDGTSPSSENGFGYVTVGTDKKLTYFLSEEGEKALAESADGYIIDYVTYTGADGKEYTVQVIITKDPDFHTNALEFGGEIRHETHYSYMDDSQYKVQSSSGDDVLEFGRVGKESHIHTGLGDDEIHITQGLFGNSTINVSVGDNKVL